MKKNNFINAAYVIIGDEILSGRTKDKNLNFLAVNLAKIGISLKEVRVVPDIEKEIIDAVNILRKKFAYVFTSGGIGPTHDDITALAIAKAFKDKLIKNKEAEQILIDYYGKAGVNEARLKMAHVPSKARLLDNPISSAPGFIIDNVIVMAGVPKIMRAMFRAAKKELIGGNKILSKELRISLTESIIARDLGKLQNKFSNVSMGSYPSNKGTSLVFRSADIVSLEKSFTKMIEVINSIKQNAIIDIK
jgi:molybdenum cofactor synthesis domain-containing protein